MKRRYKALDHILRNRVYGTLFSTVKKQSCTKPHIRNPFLDCKKTVLYETSSTKPFFSIVKNGLVRNLIGTKPKKGSEFVTIL